MKMIMERKKIINSSDIYNLAVEFGDLAGEHAESLGLGQKQIVPRNMTWMVSSNRLEFFKNNTFGDTLVTWPKEPGRIECLRDYVLKAGDEVIVGCRAKWFLFDFENKKICRASEVEFNGEYIYDDSIDSSFDKLREKEDLELYRSVIIDEKYLDYNNHVNNCKYLWLFEDLIPENIKYLQIDYKNQALLNDKIDVYIARENNILTVIGKILDKTSFIAEIGE